MLRPPANELLCDTVNYSKYESKLSDSVEQKLTYWTELCFLHSDLISAPANQSTPPFKPVRTLQELKL